MTIKYLNPNYVEGGSESKYLSLVLSGNEETSATFDIDELTSGTISEATFQQIKTAYEKNLIILGKGSDSSVTGGIITYDGMYYTISIQSNDTVYQITVDYSGNVTTTTTETIENFTETDKTNLEDLSFYLGVNTVTSLTDLPVTRRSIVANLDTASSLSLYDVLTAGRELYIRIYNNSSSEITQPIPNTGNFVSMNGTSVTIPAGSFIEMSIWAYGTQTYSIRIGEVES